MIGTYFLRSDSLETLDETPTNPRWQVLAMGLDELGEQAGWQVEEFAARVHYRGDGDRYSVEYYAPSGCVLYWRVKGDGETAVPVSRETVPLPLRERIRQDLAEADIAAAVEGRSV